MDSQASEHPLLLESQFALEEKLGEGGMGEVYRARNRETGELCALKILKSHDRRDNWLHRFRRE